MYKKFLFGCFFVITFVVNSYAALIEVLDLGNGFYRILSDGQPYGGAVESQLSKSAVDRILKALDNGTNQINRTPIPNTNPGGGFGGGGSSGKGTTSASATNNGALVPKSNTTTAVTKYEPNVAKTGTSTTGGTTPTKQIGPSKSIVKTPTTQTPATSTTNTTTSAPKQLGPGTGGTGGGAGGGGTGTPPKTTSSPKTTGGNVVGSGLAILGGVVGAVDFADAEKPKDRKTNWGDVARSAGDGAAMAAGTAAVINLIPGLGQIGYGAAIAVGAVGGAIAAGRKAFSETDCEYDPVIGVYSCCHTSKAMSNIQARNVDIGGEMFCNDFPYITKCVQGRKEHETDQGFRGLFMNDHWSKECRIKYCPGYSEPIDPNGGYSITPAAKYTDDGGACWYWLCPEGMTRDGAKCVADVTIPGQKTNITPPPADAPDNAKGCKTDADCVGDKLPQYATAGRCIQKNKNERVCAATACQPGTYLVKKNGRSMGWCRAGTEPNENQSGTMSPQQDQMDAGEITPSTIAPSLPTPVRCSDPDNMDSNCKCIVAGTVERGGKCVCRDDNQEIKNGKCEWTAKYVAGLESDLDSKFNGLTATIGGFEKNVWRDENGEFNTARLASDSIAGVVLGTVGGIVTANLVKKAQVKQGFEDIGCYIGGQSVAGYGDEFNVGR